MCNSRDKGLPFNLRYPEYNLMPQSSFDKSMFRLRERPDYIEDPQRSVDKQYLFMVKKNIRGVYKFGILYWYEKKTLWIKRNRFRIIIKCKYDKIQKVWDNDRIYFICVKKDCCEYRDSDGNLMQ